MAPENETTTAFPEFEVLGKKSWTAYVPSVATSLLVIFAVTPLVYLISRDIAALFLLVTTFIVMSEVRSLQSIRLYYNREGVWVSYGFFPWNKGAHGVKWRDLQGATYCKTLSSRLFKSYSVRIAHRSAKDSEIFLTDIARGDLSATRINDRHQWLLKSGKLR